MNLKLSFHQIWLVSGNFLCKTNLKEKIQNQPYNIVTNLLLMLLKPNF